MFRFLIFLGCLVLAWLLSACDAVEESKGPVIQPKKEATWVRTEKVETTKNEALFGKDKPLAEVPVNISLAEKLTTQNLDSMVMTDKISCLARLTPLDTSRTSVQKTGGLWHAFERNPDSKPYSFNGMQLDSSVNKMVFGLRHLCETSQGVPLNDLAIELNKLIEVHGREKAEKILFIRGEHPEDIKKLFNYQEFAYKISERKIEFKVISNRFGQAEHLINFYVELSNRRVDAKSINTFLSDSVTLLKVLNEFIQTDQLMVMALKEDTLVPYHHEDQDM